jgi:hypothetical protein
MSMRVRIALELLSWSRSFLFISSLLVTMRITSPNGTVLVKVPSGGQDADELSGHGADMLCPGLGVRALDVGELRGRHPVARKGLGPVGQVDTVVEAIADHAEGLELLVDRQVLLGKPKPAHKVDTGRVEQPPSLAGP